MAANVQRCHRCQREVQAGACFCPACGARVTGAPRRLRRRRDGEKLAGVCGGLAEHFDVDPTLIRVVYIVATFFTGILPGIFLYVILALVIPTD